MGVSRNDRWHGQCGGGGGVPFVVISESYACPQACSETWRAASPTLPIPSLRAASAACRNHCCAMAWTPRISVATHRRGEWTWEHFCPSSTSDTGAALPLGLLVTAPATVHENEASQTVAMRTSRFLPIEQIGPGGSGRR